MIGLNLIVVFAYLFSSVSAHVSVDIEKLISHSSVGVHAHNLRTHSLPRKEIRGKSRHILQQRAKDEKAKAAAAKSSKINAESANVYEAFPGFTNFRLAYRDITGKGNTGYIIGANPRFGDSQNGLNTVLVPIMTTFHPTSSAPVSFDSTQAVYNIKNSPIFNNAQFPNGNGQYLTQLMKANFPDSSAHWNLKFNRPRVDNQIEFSIPNDQSLVYVFANKQFGLVLDTSLALDFMGNYIEEQVAQSKAAPGTIFFFVSKNTYISDAAGFHFFYYTSNGQPYYFIWTSWFSPQEFPYFPYFYPDTYTLAHEVAELVYDYDVMNDAPNWVCPTYTGSDTTAGCTNGEMGFEVGDVLNCGNGPVPPGGKYLSHGYEYSLQTVALWEWFTANSSVTGQNGAYSFPDASLLPSPAQLC